MLTFNPQELERLNKRLQALAEKIGKKAMRGAARKAMTKVRNDVKAAAPEDLNDDDNVKIKTSVAMLAKWKGKDLYVKVGIRGGAKKNPDTPYYFRMVEFGTAKMAARPFMRPALESNAQQIMDTVVQELNRALDKA